MKPFRSAIVGCSGRGRMHALAYEFVHAGELVACCDLDSQRAQDFSAEFHLHPYQDITNMIQKEKPDLVHLVTAPSTRVDLMSLVDELGVPACLVEKPIAYEVRDWKALETLANRTKTLFGVGAQFRYHPDLVRCRQAIQSGQLGQVRLLDISAVGTICDQGVHGLDWAMSLIDDNPPVRVFGAVSGAENLAHRLHPSPDTSIAQIKFANGALGIWNNGHTARRVIANDAYYMHGQVSAYAELGHVIYEEFNRWEILSPAGLQQGHVDDLGWMQGNHLAQAALTEGMFTWLQGGMAVGTQLERALVQWNAVLGLYASSLWQRPVNLPFDPPNELWNHLVSHLTERS